MQIEDAFHEPLPPISLGLSSVILGAISLALFFLPVIAIPIAGCAIAAAVLGLLGGLFRRRGSLRLCVAGLLLSSFDVAVISALNAAADGYFSPRAIFPVRQLTPDRRFTAPPAPPRAACRGQLINQQMRGSDFAACELIATRHQLLICAAALPLTSC